MVEEGAGADVMVQAVVRGRAAVVVAATRAVAALEGPGMAVVVDVAAAVDAWANSP